MYSIVRIRHVARDKVTWLPSDWCTRNQNMLSQENARSIPDPFTRERVGSGAETMVHQKSEHAESAGPSKYTRHFPRERVGSRLTDGRTNVIGASLSEPHITSQLCAFGGGGGGGTYVRRHRAPPRRQCTGPHAMFCAVRSAFKNKRDGSALI